MWRTLQVWWLFVLCWNTQVVNAAAPALLDIYFEESHAGTFYHLATTLPLDEPHTLVLVDAHSDASAVADSDRVRGALRQAPNVEARDALLARWREEGAIQCYDWLEPLMPAPFEQVWWVAAPKLNPREIGRSQTMARESLDGLVEAFPRESGKLGPRFHATDWEGFVRETSKWPRDGAVVATLDLDYFAKVPDERLAAEFERVFAGLLRLPGLRALTISLSTPWVRNLAQAEELTRLALEGATSAANARIHYAPFATTGPDRSLRAREMERAGKAVPRFDIATAGAPLRTLLLSRRARLVTEPKLDALLDKWAAEPFLPRAVVSGQVAEPDGWHRMCAGKEARLRVEEASGGRVRWFALTPETPSTNVAGLALGFAEDEPRWLRRRPMPLGEGEELSSAALAPVLERGTKAGTALVYATVERDGELWRSNDLALTFRAGTGFRGSLSECFGRPYAFGCGLVPGGPDALVATDCANFVIAALRREGWQIPWSDPKGFAARCESLGKWRRGGPAVVLPGGAVDAGAFVYFGSHLAAVWEDCPPLGVLDAGDLVAHHLEGYPEIVPLGKLLEKHDHFELLRLAPVEGAVRVVLGGDVMLGRKVAETIERGENPLADLAPTLRGADFAIVNLECVASELGEAAKDRKLRLRAHPRAPALLAEAGIDAVSLANNHAHDFGDAAFAEAAQRLAAAGVRSADGSAQPVWLEQRGVRLAFFACEDSASEALCAAIREAAKSGVVVVMPHWGTEQSTQPDEEQRALAQRLTEAGARLIVGSGPHTRQPLVVAGRTAIAWSLGNLVFDGPGPDAAWSRGALLEVTLAKDGRFLRVRELPVRIGDDGRAALDE